MNRDCVQVFMHALGKLMMNRVDCIQDFMHALGNGE